MQKTDYLKKEANMTVTENGAAAFETSGSFCLDLFAAAGALRNADDKEIVARFVRAYTENADLAMKILFFARDVRGGLGERRFFRTVFSWLAANEPESVKRNIGYVAMYGRYDDLLALMGTPCERAMLAYLKEKYEDDVKSLKERRGVSILGKWLPSVNASNKETVRNAKKIARAFGINDAEYRKTVTALRAKLRLVENNLREKDYWFGYESVPSRALFKYRKAFMRNDREKYSIFLEDSVKGKTRMHADGVAPYELVAPYLTTELYWDRKRFMKDIGPEEQAVLDATWNALPGFGGNENALAVIDTSGSMYCGGKPMPAAVALSLGLYFAEHNKGIFANRFIEFSARPQLIEILGRTFTEKMRYVSTFNEIADTNLEAVFDLVLNAATDNKVSQEELPAKLVIISDMEFNACVSGASETVFENAKAKYEKNGYRLPEVVFWNVASRNRHQPVTVNDKGVALVSGVTPRLFSMIAGGNLSPYAFMENILNGKRYEKITA